MNPVIPYKPSENSNLCSDILLMAERELSAFFKAVTQLFGAEQAELSADEWLREFRDLDSLPASVREWRAITARVSTRLASRVNAALLPTESLT